MARAPRPPYGHMPGYEGNLAPGVTCGDCARQPGCAGFFGSIPEDTRCDWVPSAFVPASRLAATAAAKGGST